MIKHRNLASVNLHSLRGRLLTFASNHVDPVMGRTKCLRLFRRSCWSIANVERRCTKVRCSLEAAARRQAGRLAASGQLVPDAGVDLHRILSNPHRTVCVKGYSMPAIGHRNVTVPLRVLAGVE